MALDPNRNLLFGILALQMDFISREQLVAATSKWLMEKTSPIEDILVEQSALSEEDRSLLIPLVARHIDNHDADPEKSLAALTSIGSVGEDLQSLDDPQLKATLSIVSRDRRDLQFANAHITSEDQGAQRLVVDRSSSRASRFRILRPHAKGGLGEVSVAEDTELKREVALKEIQSKFANDPNSRARFLLEAEVTGGLEHPGIVPVYGLGQYADGRPYYAMRFIRGDSLQEAADRFHGKVDTLANSRTGDDDPVNETQPKFDSIAFRKLLGRFVDVCNAIEYAHSRGVLHRDLKPGNIMLGKYGETLVVDWGLAKPRGCDQDAKVYDESTLTPSSGSGSAPTQMGSAIGTPAYMPPEQAAGKLDELGPASDVYSLGATLYYLLTGQPPVQGKSLDEVLKKVRAGDVAPPREIKHDIPKALEAICLRAMANRSKDRYDSPRELASDVERFLADETVSAYRESLPERTGRFVRKHRGAMQAAAAALVLIPVTVALVFVVIAQRGTERQRSMAVAAEQVAKDAAEKEEIAKFAALAAERRAKDEEAKAKLAAEREARTKRMAIVEKRNADKERQKVIDKAREAETKAVSFIEAERQAKEKALTEIVRLKAEIEELKKLNP
jgi:serine/threonine protein kinase